MQYKIPQNVRREDKIVGPLTLKQLVIVGAGGGISYAAYVALQPSYVIFVWLPATAIPAILTLALAFLKINGIPFYKWVFLAAEYAMIPRKRIFIMGGADNYQATIFAKTVVKDTGKQDAHAEREKNREEKIKNLGEITKMLDSYGKPPKAI